MDAGNLCTYCIGGKHPFNDLKQVEAVDTVAAQKQMGLPLA
jgi:hypothetical protein